MPAITDEADPEKTLDWILKNETKVHYDSGHYLSDNWETFHAQHPEEYIALRRRYGATPPYFVEFAPTFKAVIEAICKKYPQTWHIFSTIELHPKNFGDKI